MTNKEIEERMTAFDEAISALDFWMDDQAESQKRQARKAIKQIKSFSMQWYIKAKKINNP